MLLRFHDEPLTSARFRALLALFPRAQVHIDLSTLGTYQLVRAEVRRWPDDPAGGVAYASSVFAPVHVAQVLTTNWAQAVRDVQAAAIDRAIQNLPVPSAHAESVSPTEVMKTERAAWAWLLEAVAKQREWADGRQALLRYLVKEIGLTDVQQGAAKQAIEREKPDAALLKALLCTLAERASAQGKLVDLPRLLSQHSREAVADLELPAPVVTVELKRRFFEAHPEGSIQTTVRPYGDATALGTVSRKFEAFVTFYTSPDAMPTRVGFEFTTVGQVPSLRNLAPIETTETLAIRNGLMALGFRADGRNAPVLAREPEVSAGYLKVLYGEFAKQNDTVGADLLERRVARYGLTPWQAEAVRVALGHGPVGEDLGRVIQQASAPVTDSEAAA